MYAFQVILFSCLPYIVAWTIVASATGVDMLYLSRIFVGISHALLTTTVYTVEIASRDVRGTYSLWESVLRYYLSKIIYFLKYFIGLGALVAFPIYLSMLFRPVRMLADKFNTLQMGLVAAERVFNVLDKKDLIKNEGEIKPERLKGKVAFEEVGFAYIARNYILKDLSFTIQPGETLAIVGSTGSGKSTIINILNRFYEIQK